MNGLGSGPTSSRRPWVAISAANLDRVAPGLLALEAMTPLLGAEEVARLSGKRERVLANIALRVALASVIGAEQAAVPFAIARHGKPALPSNQVAFSLAHIEGWALIAITETGPVGIDIERERVVSMSPWRQSCFEAAARAMAGELPLQPTQRFIQAWTRLEAVGKATGEGVARLLGRLGIRHEPVTESELATTARALLNDRDLEVRDLAIAPECRAAMALPRGALVRDVTYLPETGPELAALVHKSAEPAAASIAR